eukprot:gb/GECG01006247.1/.p1 GENE.gb/GECG01006247.1/~~gb/GECG01006247.1/.p1  ORF type:complete len:634 (+),score=73.53 gb/GECG01006247.1/:1-1902(+)
MSSPGESEATPVAPSADDNGSELQPQLLAGIAAKSHTESANIPITPGFDTEKQTEDTKFTEGDDAKKKRHQVRRACAPCAKAKRKCAGERPCPRCVELKKADQCVDVITKAQRKRLNSEQPLKSPKKRQNRSNGSKSSNHPKLQRKRPAQREKTVNGEATAFSSSDPPGLQTTTGYSHLHPESVYSTASPVMQTVYNLHTGVPLSVYLNNDCLRYFNLSSEKLERTLQNKEELRLVHPADAEMRVLAVLQAASQREPKYTFTCRFLRNITSQEAYSNPESNGVVDELFEEFEMTELNQLYTDVANNRLYRTVWGLYPRQLSTTQTLKSDVPIMSKVAENLRAKLPQNTLSALEAQSPTPVANKPFVKDVDYSIQTGPQHLELHFLNPALADHVLPVDRVIVSLRPHKFQVMASSDGRSIHSIELKDNTEPWNRFQDSYANPNNPILPSVAEDLPRSIGTVTGSANFQSSSLEDAQWLPIGQQLSTHTRTLNTEIFPSTTSFNGNSSSTLSNSQSIVSASEKSGSATTTLCSNAMSTSRASLLNVGGFDFGADPGHHQNGDIFSGFPVSLEDVSDEVSGSFGDTYSRHNNINWGTGVSIKEPTLAEPAQADLERVSSVSSFDSVFGSSLSELQG